MALKKDMTVCLNLTFQRFSHKDMVFPALLYFLIRDFNISVKDMHRASRYIGDLNLPYSSLNLMIFKIILYITWGEVRGMSKDDIMTGGDYNNKKL